MKNFRLHTSYLALAVLVIAGIALAANTGSVTGRVTDKKTGEPLVGASVVVEGTELGNATDLNGQYQIINIPPGKYTLVSSYTGYNNQKVTDVLVIQDNTATVDFKMGSTLIEMPGVDIIAK